MIWIQSCANDMSTFHVIDWLDHYQKKWFRTNDDYTHFITLSATGSATDFQIQVKTTEGTEVSIQYNTVSAYWYRRGYHIFDLVAFTDNEAALRTSDYLKSEAQTLKEFLFYLLKQKRHINSFADNSINKLQVLAAAQQAGLLVPEYYIVSDKAQLAQILATTELISKSMSISGFKTSKYHYSWGTSILNRAMLEDAAVGDNFYPSLVQRHIKKRFEVRTFYLHGTCYSSAILSQNDAKTQIDFRNYNFERPNRSPPFQLPEELALRLDHLFQQLGINSGSADLIYAEDRQFYFLEINPVGQFTQVSFPCNYFIERSIAKYLSDE